MQADRHNSSVDVQQHCCLFTAHLRPLRGGNIPAAIAVANNIAMLFMFGFGFSRKVKWF